MFCFSREDRYYLIREKQLLFKNRLLSTCPLLAYILLSKYKIRLYLVHHPLSGCFMASVNLNICCLMTCSCPDFQRNCLSFIFMFENSI